MRTNKQLSVIKGAYYESTEQGLAVPTMVAGRAGVPPRNLYSSSLAWMFRNLLQAVISFWKPYGSFFSGFSTTIARIRYTYNAQ